MSPFATLLKSLRINRGLRQTELAELVGYEQSYVSALELDIKGPPNQEFISHLVGALELSQIEQDTLNEAVAASERKLRVPPRASNEIYLLLHKLRQQIDHLHPAKIQLINSALNLPIDFDVPSKCEPSRVRRRYSKTNLAEAKM